MYHILLNKHEILIMVTDSVLSPKCFKISGRIFKPWL